MTGCLFVILGASGAGKDSIIHAIKQSSVDLEFTRRVITREINIETEDFESVTNDVFDIMRDENAFIFSWNAHGLKYGIRRDILDHLKDGRHCVINGSRKALPAMLDEYPALIPILVTVDPNVLERRLRSRGRENEDEIAARISRSMMPPPEGCYTISNNGMIEETAKECIRIMKSIINMNQCASKMKQEEAVQ
jgi:phosphonate metabolism protein PhnN/1,5-bisphosphokinase (PRPP-forming)